MANNRASGHLTGGKFTASHTTVIEAAVAPARAAAGLDCVTKISLGLIQTLRNGPPTIKFLHEGPGCLLVKVRGTRSIQEVRVYTRDQENTQVVMEAAFPTK
jgi:hypothetical protein